VPPKMTLELPINTNLIGAFANDSLNSLFHNNS
jgi:hypothetical protein